MALRQLALAAATALGVGTAASLTSSPSVSHAAFFRGGSSSPAPAPVPAPANASGGARNIVIAVDHSNGSVNALDWAIQNHLRKEDKITLLHVESPTDLIAAPGVYAALSDVTLSKEALEKLKKEQEEKQAAADEKLRENLCGRCDTVKLACSLKVVRDADARERIVSEVETVNADALILGSRGMGPLNRLLLGSVSDYCVHHAPCPVIVVRSPASKQQQQQ
eukprot:TRINITY_DN4409_c0_g1_i1.p1 TRINITY_DN4409_c0_g1~~TRINITY_DN4409_c0_g1_i1.p1  ORF type:complete len:222 (+),score=68.00 TRINITY_DN4409_c0_g1_i1:141-806(+)